MATPEMKPSDSSRATAARVSGARREGRVAGSSGCPILASLLLARAELFQFFAAGADLQALGLQFEAELAADFAFELFDFFALELDNFFAILANDVAVIGV